MYIAPWGFEEESNERRATLHVAGKTIAKLLERVHQDIAANDLQDCHLQGIQTQILRDECEVAQEWIVQLGDSG